MITPRTRPVDDTALWEPAPERSPRLPLDPHFDLADRSSQLFLRDFLSAVADAPWRRNSTVPLDPFTPLLLWMALPCFLGKSASGRCCGILPSVFHFAPAMFEACLTEAIQEGLLPGYECVHARKLPPKRPHIHSLRSPDFALKA